ncbi:cAMP-dependent protein kinase type I-alpha regulatory subunit, putative [Perkinsus marinus ATCC 50983]|uniref:cAMP-dependent protein kinase type I-alpha regulatory subunit, putative n=1 Tax=Perkinsus marinus (strain ATCC 50983 / TXsc) TaxID=423536 RepID=C5K9Q7_PERM5|nr:cAMP-dependent protein kinase type I-alpha regulatory subunit, putative [Perkinsus marinus ATCC 50983]EER18829.1 cAMP-dependent protein kinase type I-alpha regulatory subunit, putative [Perkinsus marinus ATCC 50983]|eukprot:XP_002787033.1 cAMP-dependent protein kinase type I-alpha regulatory subunit, putative [Perkinsus marinus ATCC 50983]
MGCGASSEPSKIPSAEVVQGSTGGSNGSRLEVPTTERRRRSGVSAQTVSEEDRKNWVKPVNEKDESTQKMLRDIIRTNERLHVLFGHLDEEEITDVIMAMYPGSFSPGDILIKQGDEGDAFWIVESGQYDIYVLSCTKGACFGELALMYKAPRAATVKCTEAGKTWGLDRLSFQMMVISAESTKKKKYEDFLRSMPILKDLNHYELCQLSDMLEPKEHKAGDVLMKQGEPGDNFYILESGEAKACLTGEDGNEVVAKVYNTPGDYFGELALLTKAPRKATVYASGKGCRVLSLSKEKFDRVLGPIRRRLEDKMSDYPQYADIIQQQAECEPGSPSDMIGSSDDEESNQAR